MNAPHQRPQPDLTPAQACARLGLPRSTFWELVHARNVPRIQYSARLVRFAANVIEDLRQTFMVRTPADARRVADGRRKACAGSAGAP